MKYILSKLFFFNFKMIFDNFKINFKINIVKINIFILFKYVLYY